MRRIIACPPASVKTAGLQRKPAEGTAHAAERANLQVGVPADAAHSGPEAPCAGLWHRNPSVLGNKR